MHSTQPPANPKPVLISHALCPYVQRAAIVLLEKGVEFERRDVDLANKPAWFLDISPLGKTPVLLAGGAALFESAAICEYLDDTTLPRLHPADPLTRARHRAWMEFGSETLNTIAGFYNAADEAILTLKARELHAKFARMEHVLGDGPYFNGAAFCIVDAVFAPVFRYFEGFKRIGEFGFFDGLPKVNAWRASLAARPSVRAAARPDYAERLLKFLLARASMLSRRILAQQPDAFGAPMQH
ncbi:MAG: glutathione S-transferase [Betaproteobacteria bacterium]|nr:glutathione S-transferase [Betaproteobacteria bacterium]